VDSDTFWERGDWALTARRGDIKNQIEAAKNNLESSLGMFNRGIRFMALGKFIVPQTVRCVKSLFFIF
jgi:hypothetical protein